MCRKFLQAALLVSVSVLTGWVSWNGYELLLPASSAFPTLWSLTKTRLQAAVVSAAYFLAASRGLPQGVANFYASDISPAVLLWLTASTSFVLIHSVLWTDRIGSRKPVQYFVCCIVMAIPPFGILGWAHPVTSAGVLFPGAEWWGLAAMLACLTLMASRYWRLAAAAITVLWIGSAWAWTPPALPASWIGVDLRMGASLGRDAGLERQQALIDIARNHPPGTTLVLPESALGFWTPTTEKLWRARLAGTGVTIIAGAAIVDDRGYDNVLVRLSTDGADVLYRERMPVPGSMWQPWRSLIGDSGGANAHFFANPVADISSLKAAPLICYEQLLVWPILESAYGRPDVIIAVGNGWWTAGTSIIDIQRASTVAWARLFDLPLVISFNS